MQNIMTIALSRLAAQQRAMDVTATNIANAATQGFQAERMVFADWLVREPAGAMPPGGQVMTYAQDRATYRDTRAGPMGRTGNPLDLALGNADGFFTVQTPNGPRLTRAGHFELSAGGTIVDTDGNALLDAQGRPIQVAPADGAVTVTGDGTVSGRNGQLGRIAVVQSSAPQSLRPEGGRLFATDQPTQPVAAPKVTQGMLEASNVQPVLELTRMMNDLRSYEFVGQLVQAESDRQLSAIDRLTQRRS
jgi:flagellar basal-body rod protein FlgF